MIKNFVGQKSNNIWTWIYKRYVQQFHKNFQNMVKCFIELNYKFYHAKITIILIIPTYIKEDLLYIMVNALNQEYPGA